MTFDPIPYNLLQGFLHWLGSFAAACAVSLFVGIVISLLTVGRHGPGLVFEILGRAFSDLFGLSVRRIGAITSLTIKESFRKKAFAVLVVFIVLFLLAGFFLRAPEGQNDMPAKPFIAFVLTTILWMCLPVALLLSCWGLPTDIKDRSLHTVVTKPVRRSEVVIGRMLGYGAVTTAFLAIMSVVGYVFINRSVPPEQAKAELISRVPVYGTISYLGDDGEETTEGKNVGDIWKFRSYIEGNTKAAFIWKFDNLDVNALRNQGSLNLENRFEAFRSYKGQIGEPVRYRITLVNPKTGLRVSNADLTRGVAEFSEERQQRSTEAGAETPADSPSATVAKEPPTAVVTIPAEIAYVDFSSSSGNAEAKTANLFNDLIDGNSLTIEVTCLDGQQYLGASRSDLFIRMPDRPFASTYFKSILSLWLMLMLVVLIGTTASTFVKGPVATLLTFSMVILGQILRPGMDELLKQFGEKREVLGGGALESLFRVVTQMNQQSELPDNIAFRMMKWVDARVFDFLTVVKNIIPNFQYFDTAAYSANGFDVSWDAALLPSIATFLAYIIPCILLGYFSLQLRELEAK